MTSTSCNRCHAETELTIINFADGEADPLRIRLKQFPLRTCPEGHRQFVRPEFAFELLRHLTEEDEPELPAGEEKGLIMKKKIAVTKSSIARNHVPLIFPTFISPASEGNSSTFGT